MKHLHNMPFGGEPCPDDGTRFRLWAPKANTVELCLTQEDGELCLPMGQADLGWFELCTDRARAGSRYKFRIDSNQTVPDPASRFQPLDVHGPCRIELRKIL